MYININSRLRMHSSTELVNSFMDSSCVLHDFITGSNCDKEVFNMSCISKGSTRVLVSRSVRVV